MTFEQPEKKAQSPLKYILEEQKLRSRQDLLKLRVAVDSAENILNPNRELLHNIYRQIIIDPNLTSQWESRKMKTKERPFKVVSGKDTEDVAATEILEAEWFFCLMDEILESKAWGFSLIEFGPLFNGEFLPYQVVNPQLKLPKMYPAINSICRDNVKPEVGLITATPGATTGISMTDPKYANHLMFVGGYKDFGWLFKAAKYILFKDNCLGNWSEWAEVFGMDKRVGYTMADGPAREKFLRAIRDLGTNAYGVFTPQDKIEYLGTQRSDAFGVYEHLINKIDEQMSKLIFGQDVVSNQTGRVVGTVGENVSNMYGTADAQFVSFVVNKRLFPMMANLGFTGFEGKKFMFDTTEKVSLLDRSQIDQNVANMGGRFDKDYLEKTYGVNLTEVSDPTAISKPDTKSLKKDDKRIDNI